MLFQIAYLTIGSWIGFICYRETMEVLTDDRTPEPTDYFISTLVTFAAILGWIVLVPVAFALRFWNRDR